MILQKQIQTSKATILVIGNLPGSAKILRSDIGVLTVELQNENLDTSDYAIPVGEWKPLGFLKDITEDVAKGLISKFYDFDMIEGYSDGKMIWNRATEAINSLIEANCKLKNKYCSKPMQMNNYFGDPEFTKKIMDGFNIKWQEEQSQVFTNPFLFKKI